jgi:hypothetical protein
MKSSTALPYSSSADARAWIAANAVDLSALTDIIGPHSPQVSA